MTTLVIVESPTKAKTLRKYLGSGYRVLASMGHVRDLPPKQLGVDVEHGFKPSYHLTRRGGKTLQELRLAIASSERVILATDPDREGEAIAWHIQEACKKELRGKPVSRARFHEITESAVRAALADPQPLDMQLVDAQQARRVLDRLVGYEVSPVLWKGISGPKGLSAGRVQSVALRLVVERDREIENFKPEEYWTLQADLSKAQGAHFLAGLYQAAGKKPELKSQVQVQAVVDALQGADWRVADVKQEQQSRKPYPPYITSSLQRDASVRLGWPAKKTRGIAQELYEGVKLPDGGQAGLITYMRTDSTAVSPQAQAAAREVIQRFYPEALPARPPEYVTKVKNAQEAHEAIRPTDPGRLPKEIRAALTPEQDQLYTLIWRRFIASQMKPAEYHVTTVTIHTAKAGKPLPYVFRAVGRRLLAPGFLQVYEVKEETLPAEEQAEPGQALPPLAAGDGLICHRLLPEQHFTKPPPRFSDAALIQELERLGIGRPSTFASIVDTLYEREYMARVSGRLQSTELGRAVWDFLFVHFTEVFDVAFTAQMEDRLDDIANGQARWQAVMEALWTPLASQVKQAESAAAAAPKIKVAKTESKPRRASQSKRSKARAQPSGQNCPKCGQPLVQRTSKFGPFLGCSGFPKCRYTEKLAPPVADGSGSPVR